jgi:hypothetical protein
VFLVLLGFVLELSWFAPTNLVGDQAANTKDRRTRASEVTPCDRCDGRSLPEYSRVESDTPSPVSMQVHKLLWPSMRVYKMVEESSRYFRNAEEV